MAATQIVHTVTYCLGSEVRAKSDVWVTNCPDHSLRGSRNLSEGSAADLRDDGHFRPQLPDAHLADVQGVDADGAAVQLHQPEQAVDQRALARACRMRHYV